MFTIVFFQSSTRIYYTLCLIICLSGMNSYWKRLVAQLKNCFSSFSAKTSIMFMMTNWCKFGIQVSVGSCLSNFVHFAIDGLIFHIWQTIFNVHCPSLAQCDDTIGCDFIIDTERLKTRVDVPGLGILLPNQGKVLLEVKGLKSVCAENILCLLFKINR